MKFINEVKASGAVTSAVINESLSIFQAVLKNSANHMQSLIVPISNEKSKFIRDLEDEGYDMPKIFDVALSYFEKHFDHAMEWEKY